MKQNKVLITGGHAGTTALATIEEIHSQKAFDEVVWIGNKKAFEHNNAKTLEAKVFADLDVSFYEVDSGRLQRKWTPQTITALAKVPIGFIHAFRIVSRERPDIVLSFGGAISVSVAISAWILGIPIVVHEQTIAVGLANKIVSFFAEKIALARVESKVHFNSHKCVHIGNPISKNLRNIVRKEPKGRPVLFITGGSRGAKTINEVIFQSIDTLTKKYTVIHQTGDTDIEHAKEINNPHYQSFAFIHPRELKTILENVHIMIARAGANTVAEVIAFSIPTIFIPIPWVRYNEQNKNAQLARRAHIAEIIDQDSFDTDTLSETLQKVENNYSTYTTKELTTTSKDLNAHKNLVRLLLEITQ